MARKSRKQPLQPLLPETEMQEKGFHAALYLRLSMESYEEMDANSLGHQREICLDYLKDKPEIQVWETYMDNGFSGTNFDRTDFQRMVADIQNGTINCVVVKDLSRFGRNYLDVDEYLNEKFPQWGVRFISVLEGFDTSVPNKDGFLIIPFRNIGHSIRLLLGTGMRTQELLALEPRHIAEDGSSIKIEQAVTMVKGTPQIGPPKTQTSYREIPVPEKFRPSALFLRNTAMRYVWYAQRSGRFCNPSSFRKQYKTALEELGDVRILSPHCCRHTYVSQLQAQGVPLETIQALAGHTEIDMTQHYLHVQPEVKTAAVALLNQLAL